MVLQSVDVSLGDVEELAEAFVTDLDHGGHYIWDQLLSDDGILVLEQIAEDLKSAGRPDVLMDAKEADDLELTLDQKWILIFEFGQRCKYFFDDDFRNFLPNLPKVPFLLHENADLRLLRVVVAQHTAVG